MTETKTQNDQTESLPPSLSAVREMFEEFNVPDVSDEICTRVLDVLYRHTCDVVEESRAVANHTGHQNIEEGDMKLAIESISDGLLFAPPHKEQLLAYAERNSLPLPAIRTHHGLRLPNERNNLTAPNYTLAKPEAESDSQQTGLSREVTSVADAGANLITAIPTCTPQGLFRLTSTPTTMGPGSTVRLIAPSGIGPSMIRIQSVQSVVQASSTEAVTPLRAVPVVSVGSNMTTVQRRFAEIP